jgi:hypothetical protein
VTEPPEHEERRQLSLKPVKKYSVLISSFGKGSRIKRTGDNKVLPCGTVEMEVRPPAGAKLAFLERYTASDPGDGIFAYSLC